MPDQPDQPDSHLPAERPSHPGANLRISDEDRHKIAEVLREAAGEGRLEVDELDERLEAAYAAKTYADLVPITADLPMRGQTPMPAVPDRPASGTLRPAGPTGVLPTPTSSFAMMSGCDRKGPWEIGPTHTAFSVMGGVLLDLRQARFASQEVVINANAIMGAVDIVVDAWTRVSVEGAGVMGDFAQARDKVEAQVDEGAPHVRVKGVALMGAVTITRKPQPGERRRRKQLGR